MNPAKQFVANMLADMATKKSRQPRCYVVVAPSGAALKVAVHEIAAVLKFFDLAWQFDRRRRTLVLNGADVKLFAGRDPHRFLGYCIDGYWVIGPGQCSPEVVDECRYAATALQGWSLLTESTA